MTEIIRTLVEADAEELLAARIANRDFMRPYEPVRGDDYFTLERQRAIATNEAGFVFAILDNDHIAGTITLSNVSYGPFRSANIGYWVDQRRNGRGLASKAVAAIVEHAFNITELHRLEAGTLVDNIASQRVLEKNRFERIGVARRYLHINGAWRDHLLFERVAED